MSVSWLIGRDVFAYLHEFHFEDHLWSCVIPEVATLEEFEALVLADHPDFLKHGIGNM